MPTQPANSSDAYECDSCGACCRTFMVLVSEEDAAREPRIRDEAMKLAEHHTSEVWQYRLYPLPFFEGCVFLQKDQRCEIYPTRPRVCREFQAGSERCQEARRQQGISKLMPINANLV